MYGSFLFFNVAMMKQMIQTRDILNGVVNTQTILVLAHTTVIMELKPWTEVTLQKENSMRIMYLG